VHAVSLGESRAAAILVEALRQEVPGMRLLLTHGTATGWREGAAIIRSGDRQTWLPWDDPDSVGGFLSHFRPRVGILMETEVWPALVRACRQHHVPLTLANARLNNRSFQRAQRLAWLSRPAFAGLGAVWAQTDDDRDRLQQLGARVKAVTGNLKFDARPDADQLSRAARWRTVIRRPVVMLASSREGEEAEFLKRIRASSLDRQGLDAAKEVDPASAPLPLYLIVPRHPQRFDAVADMLRMHGWTPRRRAEWGAELDARLAAAEMEEALAPVGEGGNDGPNRVDSADACSDGGHDTEVWLGDSLGEMALYYSLSDVALLGGSFEPLGGQNLIEAAACGCPVIMGPHTFNFAEPADAAVAHAAALRVANMASGVAAAFELVQDRTRRQTLAEAAISFGRSRQGAARLTARAVASLLEVSAPAVR
jgi:3-deoxy-D-manno-octulosonic-acid transferase